MKNRIHNAHSNKQFKDKDFSGQRKIVFSAFKEPSTMLMVSTKTGILRANICRYVAEWKRMDKIKFLYKGLCPVSNMKAGFYCTS